MTSSDVTQVAARKPKVWEKQKKKKGKAKTNKKKPVKPLPTVKKATTVTTITPTLTPTGTPSASGDKEELKDSNPSTPNGVSVRVNRRHGSCVGYFLYVIIMENIFVH